VFSVLSISLIAGSFAGAVVAYGPKLFAGALGRLVELSGALPSLIIVGLWRIREAEPSIGGFIAVLAALKTIETARLISSETDRLSAQGFVIAARALGATKRRIFTVHVLPHLMSSLAVSSAFTAAAVIGLEAALSFVGLGLQGSGSWGALLGEVALGQLGAVAPGTLGLDPGAQTPTGRILLAWLSVTGSTLALYLLSRRAGQHLR
jgi:peptide/nickel transport system permease protein